ncbi:MAG: hypothetical protein HY657_08265 [Acidobacteria bacterium]|nr:hypothetical protein [Acidobacteriota bacterium]
MILGLHDMIGALTHYTQEHVTADGAGWILLLDGILLIPLIFAVFFYPAAVLIGVGAALLLTVGFVGLLHVLQRHRQHVGH